jgi:hypothetical protein
MLSTTTFHLDWLALKRATLARPAAISASAVSWRHMRMVTGSAAHGSASAASKAVIAHFMRGSAGPAWPPCRAAPAGTVPAPLPAPAARC